jgi:hypothetical protein
MHPDDIKKFGEERLQIRSGLYYNTTPPVSIYYINEFFFEGTVFFSDCGMYFAHVRGVLPWHRYSLGGIVVRFFESGSLIKSYRGEDVISSRRSVETTPSSARWIEWGAQDFARYPNTLTITTVENRTFTFDITTGEIISGPRDISLMPIIIAIAALLAVIIIAICKRKSKREDEMV